MIFKSTLSHTFVEMLMWMEIPPHSYYHIQSSCRLPKAEMKKEHLQHQPVQAPVGKECPFRFWQYYICSYFFCLCVHEKIVLIAGKVSLAFWQRVNEWFIWHASKQHKPLCELGQSWQKLGEVVVRKKLQGARYSNLWSEPGSKKCL